MGTGVGFTVIVNSFEGKETTVLDLGFTAGYAGLTGMMFNPSPADFNINWEIVKRQYGAQYQPWVNLVP